MSALTPTTGIRYCQARRCPSRNVQPVQGECPSCGHRLQILPNEVPTIIHFAGKLKEQLIADPGSRAILNGPRRTLLILLQPIADHPDLESIQLPKAQQEAVFVLWEKVSTVALAQSLTARREAIDAIDQLMNPNGPPHPDGPEAPRYLWLHGRRHEVEKGRPWDLLNFMFGKSPVHVDDVIQEVWPEAVMEGTVSSAITRLNSSLPTTFPRRLSLARRFVTWIDKE